MQLRARLALVIPVLFVLYFLGLNDTGLLGPDEPRYAAIGQAMSSSGDWVTPRLWGSPWFEKPALLYWMIAAGFRAGLPGDYAPRLPVALLGAAFLFLYYFLLRPEIGERPAWLSALILASTAGWMGYSRLAVTDLPLAVFFASSMLLALEWLRGGGTRRLPYAGICFGLAILAKGLVPMVLVLPLAWAARRKWRDAWLFVAPALLVAAPWYAACASVNGSAFLDEFFWRHHLSRFLSGDLQHTQPFWYYAPVLLAGLFPWTPLVVMLRRPRDEREKFFAAWLLWGFFFFSLSTNKLPGYLLPLLPAACVLLGLALDRAPNPRWPLSCCVVLLVLVPSMASVLPDAINSGIMRSVATYQWGHVMPTLLPLVMILFLWGAGFTLRGPLGSTYGPAIVFLLTAVAMIYLNREVAPVLEERVSARKEWIRMEGRTACLEAPRRAIRYGLNYYAGRALPDCP
ncbi:MAG: glycosyltransferase family 39 protein [Candidatus Solibacter usitatus]|nr:glycosyltransferase family 39 protein [Candidatus Solibacter usitatus]